MLADIMATSKPSRFRRFWATCRRWLRNRTIIVRRCAWCHCFIGLRPGLGQTGTSHGICPECYREQLEKIAPPVGK